MSQIKLRDNTVNTSGSLPAVGTPAPGFSLIGNDFKEVKLADFLGRNVILNIFPSIDTSVCATSVREFNKRASAMTDSIVLCISKDLPFAFKRFCGAEGIQNVVTLSDFRNNGFSQSYGLQMIDGGLAGLLARAIVVIDPAGNVKYTELVPVIGQEPDYEGAIRSL